MKIVILDGYSLNPGDLSWDGFKALGDVDLYDRTSENEVIERCKNAEIVITNKVILDSSIISELPDLKYIGVTATGYNVVDIKYAKEKGIVVTNIPSYSTMSVAQMVFAHILNITNHVALHADEVRKGKWNRNIDFCFWDTPQIEIAGKTIGIFGLGNTGMATAQIALAFGMKVIAFTSKDKSQLPDSIISVSKEELFRQSDIVSLHCPLTENTDKLVCDETLSLMKKSAILINTGRGALIDETALASFLNKELIAAAGLDVLSTEPPTADNPLITAKNCFITPHIAWATTEARQRLMNIAVSNLHSFLSGEIVNNVAR